MTPLYAGRHLTFYYFLFSLNHALRQAHGDIPVPLPQDPEILNYAADYRLNLIEPAAMGAKDQAVLKKMI